MAKPRKSKDGNDKSKKPVSRKSIAPILPARQRSIELDDTVFRGGPSGPRLPTAALPSTGPVQQHGPTGPQMTPSEFLEEVLPVQQLPAGMSLTQIHETLAALLVPYARRMESEMHPKIGFCLKARSARTGRETHFGAVQVLPDCVAYHLFPLYGHPELLKNVSPELHSRMRSSTCFHFATLHAALVAELAELTHAGFEAFVADGVL
jgi:hypothetical protein